MFSCQAGVNKMKKLYIMFDSTKYVGQILIEIKISNSKKKCNKDIFIYKKAFVYKQGEGDILHTFPTVGNLNNFEQIRLLENVINVCNNYDVSEASAVIQKMAQEEIEYIKSFC
jgi:hypothetical protein